MMQILWKSCGFQQHQSICAQAAITENQALIVKLTSLSIV